ncbi:acyl-[acyl-carrier-protein] thioesterase, partial [Desulfovibrio cuneatus]|uniref:acyl-[acyl-carrier-protein] thioesterase n=1 Tax=Desulfovibrio cuneatus TaxID=159728 RepID=UPI0004029E44
MHVFHETFAIRGYEAGGHGRVSLRTLCNYMEEAAGKHAEALGCGLDAMREQGITWVLARQRIELGYMPAPEENMVVHTWPVGVERLSFRRDFHMECNGHTVLRAVSHWVLMNATTRKLEKMPPWAQSLAFPQAGLALEAGDIRIPPVPLAFLAETPAVAGNAVGVKEAAAALPGPEFPVRRADIDSNGHVNNVRYVDFALEAAHCFFASQGQGVGERALAGLDIVFRAEALWGDTVASASMPEHQVPGRLLHGLYRKSSGQELARVRTVWKPLP